MGVAFSWSKYKGLDVFVNLASRLSEEYRIVLVGTNEPLEEKLPGNIIPIRKTDSKKELAAIYTSADLFLNPTREDNFPTVNIEALATGTPVLTFDTNGSPEIIDVSCGRVVEYGNIDAMEQAIYQMIGMYSQEDCRKRAEKYALHDRYKEYMKIYER